MSLDMLPFYVFWLGRENVILFVCNSHALPAINPGVKPSKLFLMGAQLTSLLHLTLINA